MQLGIILGPLVQPPLMQFICSPVSMVLKKDSTDMRMITHLSHPGGSSLNSFIAPAESSTTYQDFQHAVQLVIVQGHKAWMDKEDVKSAFCNVPI